MINYEFVIVRKRKNKHHTVELVDAYDVEDLPKLISLREAKKTIELLLHIHPSLHKHFETIVYSTEKKPKTPEQQAFIDKLWGKDIPKTHSKESVRRYNKLYYEKKKKNKPNTK